MARGNPSFDFAITFTDPKLNSIEFLFIDATVLKNE